MQRPALCFVLPAVAIMLAGCEYCLVEYRFQEQIAPLTLPLDSDSVGSAWVSLDQWRGRGGQEQIAWLIRAAIPHDSVLAVHLHDGSPGGGRRLLYTLEFELQIPGVIARSYQGHRWSGAISWEDLWRLAEANHLLVDVHTLATGPDTPALVAPLRQGRWGDWTDTCT